MATTFAILSQTVVAIFFYFFHCLAYCGHQYTSLNLFPTHTELDYMITEVSQLM